MAIFPNTPIHGVEEEVYFCKGFSGDGREASEIRKSTYATSNSRHGANMTELLPTSHVRFAEDTFNYLTTSCILYFFHRKLANEEDITGKNMRQKLEASTSFTTASVSSLQDPISEPAAGSENTNIVAASPMSIESSSDSQTPKEDAPPLITTSASKLQDPPSEPTTRSGKNNTMDAVNSVKVILMTNPEEFQTCDGKEEGEISLPIDPKAFQNLKSLRLIKQVMLCLNRRTIQTTKSRVSKISGLVYSKGPRRNFRSGEKVSCFHLESLVLLYQTLSLKKIENLGIVSSLASFTLIHLHKVPFRR
ncbi:hypothetical protein YC2023_050521 [Brassica napus]